MAQPERVTYDDVQQRDTRADKPQPKRMPSTATRSASAPAAPSHAASESDWMNTLGDNRRLGGGGCPAERPGVAPPSTPQDDAATRRSLDQRYSPVRDPYCTPCHDTNPHIPEVKDTWQVCARDGCGAPARKGDGFCCNACSRYDETKNTTANPDNWNYDRHDGYHTRDCHFAHVRFEDSLALYVQPKVARNRTVASDWSH